MYDLVRNRSGAVQPRVLAIVGVIALAVGAVLAFTFLREGPDDRLKEAEAAYQAAHPPYVPPPPAPVIIVPPEVAGPQFDPHAGPGGAPAPADKAK